MGVGGVNGENGCQETGGGGGEGVKEMWSRAGGGEGGGRRRCEEMRGEEGI